MFPAGKCRLAAYRIFRGARSGSAPMSLFGLKRWRGRLARPNRSIVVAASLCRGASIFLFPNTAAQRRGYNLGLRYKLQNISCEVKRVASLRCELLNHRSDPRLVLFRITSQALLLIQNTNLVEIYLANIS